MSAPNVIRQISEWLRSEEADSLAATAASIGVSVPAVLAHAIADKAWPTPPKQDDARP